MSDPVFRSEAMAAHVEALYRRVLDQWPTPKSQLRLPTRQGETFVVACGPEDAPPVVLLHGAQANCAVWTRDVPLWSSKFRLFAIDMIGEPGLSARVRPDLAGDTHALWLDDVFKGLGLKSAAAVGVSLGGWLALDYASRRPSAITGLALLGPAGIGRQKNFLLKAAPLLLLGDWGKRKMRKLVLGPAPEAPSAELKPMADLMEAISEAIKPRVVNIPRLSDEELRALAAPMLVIVGGRDVLIDSRDTRDRLQKNAPDAEICFIEDGRHFLPGQGARIMAFLEHHVRPAGR
jgi:pimeloyl-ACP methyl ester carboxylesterase